MAAHDGTLGREELAALLTLQLGSQPSSHQLDSSFGLLTRHTQRISFENYMMFIWGAVEPPVSGTAISSAVVSAIASVASLVVSAVATPDLVRVGSYLTATVYVRRPRLIPLG